MDNFRSQSTENRYLQQKRFGEKFYYRSIACTCSALAVLQDVVTVTSS